MKRDDLNSEYEYLATLAARYDAQGDVIQAARFYRLAGEQAAAHYANEVALDYFSQALNRTPDAHIGERFSLLLAREKVYALQGNQAAGKQDLASLEFLANVLQNDESQAEVAVRQAQHYLATGQYDTAVTLSQSAAHLARIAQNSRLEAAAYMTWGKALIRLGSYDWAQTQLAQALQLAQAATVRQLEADSIRAIGLLYLNQGDLTQARFCYLKAQDIYEGIQDNRGQSYTLNNLGHIAYNRKHFTEAQQYWEKALAVYQTIGDRLGQAMVFSNLGAMYLDVGAYTQAESYNQEALNLSRQIQSPMGQSMALVNLALVNHYQDREDQALDLSQQALTIGRQMNSRRVQGYAFIPMGHALLGLDKPLEAQEAYWQSLTIWHELDQPSLVVEQRASLAQTKMAQQVEAEALAQVEEILLYLHEDGALAGAESAFRVYLTCYHILQKCQDERAQSVLETAYTRLQEQAADITDEQLRDSYLQNVPAHRYINAAFVDNSTIGVYHG